MAISGGDLGTLFASDLPEGRQNLLDSFANLERVAEYCENNYLQSGNKKQALEETKGYTTQSLASVAYQINTLAYNFLQMLDLQAAQLGEMTSQVNHIAQTVDIHKEKVARREIGVLTTNKSSNRQFKIIAPANPERPTKYVRKQIDYSILDEIGHGVKLAPPANPTTITAKRPSNASQYAPGLMLQQQLSSGMGVGPAPTTKPPTPPQANRYPMSSGGTLTRSKEYRTPSMVTPPQPPSNYAPNYPRKHQYGTLPHPQVQMVHPVQQQDLMSMGHHHGATTMPRLSSSSMRSTGSSGNDSAYGRLSRNSNGSQPTYAKYTGSTGTMNRPTQRPPSPPLPPPPQQQMQNTPPPQQYNPVYAGRHESIVYSRQGSNSSSLQQMELSSVYSRQSSSASVQQQQQQHLMRQNSAQLAAAAAAAAAASRQQLSRQSSHTSGVLPQDSSLPGWVPKNYLEKVTAIYDYNADKDDELSFSEGAVIYVLKKNDDGWWEGVMDGITGLFPGNYVDVNV